MRAEVFHMKKIRFLTLVFCAFLLSSLLFVSCASSDSKINPVSIAASETGFSFSHDSFSSFVVSEDGGEVRSASSYSFSSVVGEHTLQVWALDASDKKVAGASFSYVTVALSLSDPVASGRVVSWSSSAYKVSVKEGNGSFSVVSGDTFTSSSDDAVVTVLAEGGFDAENALYYAGSPIEKNVRVFTGAAAILSSPSLKVSDRGLTWDEVPFAVTYAVSYDGGSYRNAESASFLYEAGKHSISVKAVGDGEFYADSAPSVFTYQTEPSSVSVSKTEANRAALSFNGIALEKAFGESFEPCPESVFTAQETCEVSFRAVPGFRSSDRVFFSPSDPETVKFVAPAVRPASIEDASYASASHLADRWEVQKFDGSWKSTTASVSLAESYDGSQALCLNAWNNSVAYRFTTAYDLADGYNALRFDFKGDGIADVVLTLGDDDSGYYISYDLGVMPSYWLSVTLSLSSEQWKINGSFPLQTAWSMRDSAAAAQFEIPKDVRAAAELFEIVPFLDRLSFTVKGNTPNGSNASFLVDSVLALYDADVTDERIQPLFGVGSSYVAREELSSGNINEIALSLSSDSARVFSTALETNFVMEGEALLDLLAASLSFSDSLSDFKMTCDFSDNGSSLVVRSCSGENAEWFAGVRFSVAADLSLDFEDGAIGEKYIRDEINEYTFSSLNGWQPLSSSQIYCVEKENSNVLSFATGKWVTNRFTYNEFGRPLGIANYFAIDLGNDHIGADAIEIKLVAVTSEGSLVYLLGSADNFYSFAVTDSMVTLERKTEDPVDVVSVYLVTKNTSEKEVAYLYADNLKIRYKAEISATSSYAAPLVSADEYSLYFSHDDPSAAFEYSVNGGEFERGNVYSVPAEEGHYSLRVRALIGEDETPSVTANYSFSVVAVNLSKIDVSIDEGVHTASWLTNGVSFLKIGDGEFEPCPERSFAAEEDVTITVRAEGYYDEANKTYYVGSQEIVKKILVTGSLSAPVLTATDEGITWEAVPEADRYAVSVNDGDFIEQFDLSFPFAHTVGFYSVRVISMIGGTMAYSNAAEYHYEVKEIRLYDLKVQGSTATWAASANKVYVKVNSGEYSEVSENTYTARTNAYGVHVITVLAVGGYNGDTHVLYYGETEPTLEARITVRKISRPVLQLNDSKNGLSWSAVPYATGYLVKVNDGEWMESSDYAFEEQAGEYSVTVKATGDGVTSVDSEEVYYSYTVRTLSLSEIALTDPAEEGMTASFDATALNLYYKWGRAPYEQTELTSFFTDVTKTLYVKATGGFRESDLTYFAGEAIERSIEIVVPIYLETPTLSITEKGVFWQAIKNATGYSVSIGGGEPIVLTQTYLAFETAFGTYDLSVKAINEDPVQYPDSEEALLSYEIAKIELSDLSLTNAVVSWTYRGFLSLKIGEGEWVSYVSDSYLNESGEDTTVRVKTEIGFDKENHILYKADESLGASIEKSIEIIYAELNVPVLKLNSSKTGLEWAPVAKAYSYAASVNGGDFETVDRYPFSSVPGDYTVCVKAVGNGSTLQDSDVAVFSYTVRAISLSDITVTYGVASFTYVGNLTLQEGEGEARPYSLSTLAPEATENVVLTVSPGYVEETKVYFVGDVIRKSKKIVVPIRLVSPVLSFTQSGVSFDPVPMADYYSLSVNGGEKRRLNETIVELESVAGDYTLRISARSEDEEQYPESPVAEISYSVKTVSLSSLSQTDGILHIQAVGIVSVKEGEGAFREAGSSYAPEKSVTVTVKAESGVSVSDRVRFVGETVTDSLYVIVPIRLAAPVVSGGESSILLGEVQNADCFLLSSDGAEWKRVTSSSVAYEVSAGEHTLRVKAYSDNVAQYPESDITTFTYQTVIGSLSDLSLSGATFSWRAEAATVRVKYDSGSYSKTSATSYAATYSGSSAGSQSHTLTVKAEGGYVSSSAKYYYIASPIEKSKSVTLVKLSSPSLSAGSDRLTWGAVSSAVQYAVKVGSGNYQNQSGRESAYATKAGSYTVSVKAVGNGTTVLDSDPSAYSYTVKTVTLSNITVVGAKASWTSVAYKTSRKVGNGAYQQTTDTSYTAQGEGTYSVSVKAEGGFDSSSKTYYYAASPIEKSGTIKIVKLSAPSLSVTSSGVSWAAVSNATAYMVKIDGGEYKSQSGRTVSFSSSTGSHTVSVYASRSDNSAYVNSNESSVSYLTAQSAITFISSSNLTAVWALTGLKSQYSTDNGSTYKDTALTSYTATSSGTVKFRAVGGYDSASNTYYNGTSSAVSKTFTVSGLTLDTFDSGNASAWTKERYTTDWEVSENAAVTVTNDAFGAGKALEMKSFANGTAFRFGRSLGTLSKAYKGVSFDIKLNEYYTTAKTKIRFVDYAKGIYVNYDLAHLSMNNASWYRVVISFDDENLEVNIGGTNYSPSKIKQYIGRTEYKTWDNAIKSMDVMYVIISGKYDTYPTIYTMIDNVRLLDSASSSSASKLTTPVLDLGFEDGTVGTTYVNAKWKQYSWTGSAYASVSGKMNSRKPASSALVSLACGNSTYKYVYNEGGSALGTANHLSIDLGNWYNHLGAVKYRVAIVNSLNKTIWLAGSDDTFASLALTGGNTMKTLSFNFASVSVKSIMVFARYDGADNYIYMDNVRLASCSLS